MATLGRDAELAAVQRCLDRAAGRLSAVVFEGAAGIGKTTVLRDAGELARLQGFAVLTSRPAEAETTMSFASLADLLEPVPSGYLAALPDPQRDALEIALLQTRPRHEDLSERTIGTAVTSVLRRMTQDHPVALVVDDVQWLDVASAAALSFALRRLSDSSIAVLVAGRTDGRSRLDALGLDHSLPVAPEHRRLGPLSLSALYHVIRAQTGLIFPRPALRRIEEASGGNPLFAIELARALDAASGAVDVGRPLPVPDGLTDLIEARVSQLPRAWEEALLAVASLVHPTVPLLEQALGPEVVAALEGAAAAEVLEVRDDRVRFSHPLLASAVVASARPALRRQVHERLAALSDDPEQRARHRALAAEGPDEEVAALLTETARHAARRGAASAAVDLLELACRLTPDPDSPSGVRRRLERCEAHLRAGDTGEVQRLVGELLRSVPSGPLRAMGLELEARVLHVAGTSAEAAERCDEALDHVGDDVELQARAHATRAIVEYHDISVAHHHARRALQLLGELAEPDPTVHAQAILAYAEAEVDLGRGIPMAEVELGLELEQLAPAPNVSDRISAALGAWLKSTGDLEAARRWLEQTLRSAVEEGDDGSIPYALSHLPQLELWSGNWEAAERRAQEHLDASERMGQPGQRVQALYNLALVHAHQGRTDEALAEVEEALQACHAAGDTWSPIPLGSVLGFVHLSLGDWSAAAEHLGRAAAASVATGASPARRDAPDHAEALVAVGDLDGATRILDELRPAAEQLGSTELLAGARRSEALLAASQQRLDDALDAIEAALQLHERSGEPFGRARSLLVLGILQRRRGERRAAAAALEQARELFETLGAPLWSGRAADELRRVPQRRRATTLTAAEERVAALVAQGHTNQEVARSLFVSAKTVEANLTRIYAKLGIRSRAELAAAWASTEALQTIDPTPGPAKL